MTVQKALALRAVKGKYGYLKSSQFFSAIRTLIFFAVAFTFFILGKCVYKQYYTMFTVTAIVICIPAAMSAVAFIMFMRFRQGRREIFDDCESIHGNVLLFYDSVITTTLKSYGVNVFAVTNKNVIGYTEYKKVDVDIIEKHLKEMADKNDFRGFSFKVFTEYPKFKSRLSHLAEEYTKNINSDAGMIKLIGNLSL